MKDSGIIFLKDWSPLVSSLSIENQIYFWELFTSYEYGVEQKCDNEFVKPIWNFIKSQLDNMKEKYNERVVERNRTNGSKGGRPKKPKETDGTPKNPMGLSETQKTPNDNDNDNDNVNDNVNDNGLDVVEFKGYKLPKTHIDLCSKMMSDLIWLETFMMNNHFSKKEQVKEHLFKFCIHLNLESKIYELNKFKDFKSHFNNWHRIPKSEYKQQIKPKITGEAWLM